MKRLLVKAAGASTTALGALFVPVSGVMAQSDAADLGIFGASLVCQIISCVVGLGLLIFTILMIVDAAQRDEKVLPGKIKWIILMVVTGWIGALIYYFVRKKKMGPAKAQQQQQ